MEPYTRIDVVTELTPQEHLDVLHEPVFPSREDRGYHWGLALDWDDRLIFLPNKVMAQGICRQSWTLSAG